MRGVNKVILVGTLGADPEVKQFPNGGSITTISIATSEQWNDKQTGEKREATEWHRVTFNNKLAEIAAQYLKKGRQVYVEGSLRTRKYQDQSGQDRFITEIRGDQMQMLGSNPAGQGGGNEGYSGNNGGYNSGNNNNFTNNQAMPYNQPNPNQNNFSNNNGSNSSSNVGYNNHQGFNPNSNNGGQNGGQGFNNNATPAANPFMNDTATNATSNAAPMTMPKPSVIDDDVPF